MNQIDENMKKGIDYDFIQRNIKYGEGKVSFAKKGPKRGGNWRVLVFILGSD